MRHLWEVNHAYYCNRGNYYAPGNDQPMQEYRSFGDFIAEEGDADIDYNLVFRWDWTEGDDWELPKYNGDDNYRNGRLAIFFMGQRKGLYRWVEIEVCRNDEPSVKEFLIPRWQYLRDLWEPFSEL
jgi:hypothetical protein